jgi:transcriptional regulator with XRE-family HTH domain
MNAKFLVSSPSGAKFFELLRWHMVNGTRPLGDPRKGIRWKAIELADAAGVTDRTVRNWCNNITREPTLPPNYHLVEAAYFGNSPTDDDSWYSVERHRFRETFEAESTNRKTRKARRLIEGAGNSPGPIPSTSNRPGSQPVLLHELRSNDDNTSALSAEIYSENLGVINDEIIDEVISSNSISVNFSGIMGKQHIHTYMIDNKVTFSDLLDTIWYSLRRNVNIPAFSYGKVWILTDSKNRGICYESTMTFNKRDDRVLSDVGIKFGQLLFVELLVSITE